MKPNSRIFFPVIFLLFSAGIALGHPPTDMQLSYDIKARILHVSMSHVTSRMNKHHIRKLIVNMNGTEILNETQVRQTTPQGFEKDIPLKAKAGDVINVEAICSQGGSLEGSLTVPAPEESKK